MHPAYRPKFRLDGHNDSVMALDFTPDGSKLVSVGVDGQLFVWSMSSGKELFRYDACFSRGFASAVWLDDSRVIAGMEDGVIVLLTWHAQNPYTAYKFTLHADTAIECLACHRGGLIASGAGSEVLVFSIPAEKSVTIQIERYLNYSPNQMSKPVVTTAVQWANSISPNGLLVCYLHHGVLIWDAETSSVLRSFTIETLIGNASLSVDQRLLVVSNLATGFDVYDIETGRLRRVFHCETGVKSKRTCLPVIFIRGDEFILGGSSFGEAPVFHLGSILPSAVCYLDNQEKGIVISLAQYNNYLSSTSLIACGTAGRVGGDLIDVWEAFDGTNEESIPTPRRGFTLASFTWSLKCFVLLILFVFIANAGVNFNYLLNDMTD